MATRTTRRLVAAGALLAALGHGAIAFGQHDDHGHAAPTGHGDPQPHGAHQTPAHGGGHGEGHALGQINWATGIIGESASGEESLLWRKKGTPPPFLASVINFGIVLLVLGNFGKKPLAEGLVKRKEDLMREIDQASAVKAEAEERLEEYKSKIESLDEELARIEADYEAQGQRDKERIVREARERRERMKREAEELLEAEAKALRQQMTRLTVERAASEAAGLLAQRVTAQDQDRLAQEYLQQVATMKLSERGAS